MDATKAFSRQKIYFYIALGLLLSVLLFWRVIMPSFKSWRGLKKQVQTKAKELQEQNQKIQQIQKLKEQILTVEKTYGDFSRMFFAHDDIPAAVKAIAEISQDLGIEFISLTPQASQRLEASSQEEAAYSLWRIPIAIKIKTGYLKLIDFIKRIERANKFIKIDNLRIKKNPSNLLFHDVEMTVDVFSLQQKEPL